MRLYTLDWIAMILIIIGGINWGLVGFFDYNLIDSLFGTTVARVIYALVGLSAVYFVYYAYRETTPGGAHRHIHA